MRLFKAAAAAVLGVALFAVASMAQAVLIDTWTYTLLTQFNGTNSFNGPTNACPNAASSGCQIQNATQVSWGGNTSSTGTVFISGSDRSGITIADAVAPDPVPPTPGATNFNDPSADPRTGLVNTNELPIFPIGLGAFITHHNNSISSAFTTLLTSQIDSTLTLVPFIPPCAPPGPLCTVGPETLTFTVFFAETPNATPCVAPSPPGNPCNDIFALNPSDAFNKSFTFEGIQYFVSTFPITGGGLGTFTPLTGAECAAAGANPGCVGFTTVEGQDTTVEFGFAVTTQPIVIPEPGSLALLGIALGAVGLMRRRRSS